MALQSDDTKTSAPYGPLKKWAKRLLLFKLDLGYGVIKFWAMLIKRAF
jgi:hypothetical protein